jgi:hypothetical protein
MLMLRQFDARAQDIIQQFFALLKTQIHFPVGCGYLFAHS